MKDRNNTNTGILCHNILEKKCSSLEVCRFMNSCRYEASTYPCEGNFETVINVVCSHSEEPGSTSAMLLL